MAEEKKNQLTKRNQLAKREAQSHQALKLVQATQRKRGQNLSLACRVVK